MILQRLCSRHCTKIVPNLSDMSRVVRRPRGGFCETLDRCVLGTASAAAAGAGDKSKQFTSDYRAGGLAQYTAGHPAQIRLDFQYKYNWKSSRNTSENPLISIENPVDSKQIVWEFGERAGGWCKWASTIYITIFSTRLTVTLICQICLKMFQLGINIKLDIGLIKFLKIFVCLQTILWSY